MTDETLPISNKPKHPKKKGGEYNEQNGRTRIQEDKRITQENHKGNIKFLDPLLVREAYQIRKAEDFPKGHLA
jgi:hypothetical protein